MADDHILLVADKDHNHLAALVDHIPQAHIPQVAAACSDHIHLLAVDHAHFVVDHTPLSVVHKPHADRTQGPPPHHTLVALQ